jgi:hypothetical protein
MDKGGDGGKLSPMKDRNAATHKSKRTLPRSAIRHKRRARGDAPLSCPRLHPCSSNDPREVVRPENFNRIRSHLLKGTFARLLR